MTCNTRPRSRFDERARVVALVILIFTVAVLKHFEAAFLALAFAFLVKLLTPKTPGFWRRLGIVNLFVGLMWCFTPFSVPGPGLYSWGPFIASEGGFVLTMTLTFKANAIFLLYAGLTARMRTTDFARALSGLHVPDKLTSLLLLTARQIEGLIQLKTQLEEAAKLRGFKAGFNMHTYRTLASFVATLFIRSLNRAEVLTDALKLRGFSGVWPRVHFHPLRLQDWLYMVSMGSVAVALGLFDLALTFKWLP